MIWMMITAFNSLSILAPMYLNPVMMSLVMLALSTMMTVVMTLSMGKSWIPALIYLIFMGGVILIFMILSSTMPNSKMMKLNKKKKYLAATMLLSMAVWISEPQKEIKTELKNQIKEFLMNQINTGMITVLILLYFTVFISMLMMNKKSMRTTINYPMK